MIKESNNPFELYDTNKPLVKKATLEIYKSIRTRSWDNVEDTLPYININPLEQSLNTWVKHHILLAKVVN